MSNWLEGQLGPDQYFAVEETCAYKADNGTVYQLFDAGVCGRGGRGRRGGRGGLGGVMLGGGGRGRCMKGGSLMEWGGDPRMSNPPVCYSL